MPDHGGNRTYDFGNAGSTLCELRGQVGLSMFNFGTGSISFGMKIIQNSSSCNHIILYM